MKDHDSAGQVEPAQGPLIEERARKARVAREPAREQGWGPRRLCRRGGAARPVGSSKLLIVIREREAIGNRDQ